ncbi:hypothetical protein LTR17_027083, partial [Elasticomyces elasticus]
SGAAANASAQSVVTINGQAPTQIAQSNGAIALSDSKTTFTLSTGGAAVPIGTQIMSTGQCGGTVVGPGSCATAIHPGAAMLMDEDTKTTGFEYFE